MKRARDVQQTWRAAVARPIKKVPVLRELWYLASALLHRLAVARQSWRERAAGRQGRELVATGWPLPPPRLRFRVHGSLDPASFVEVGRRSADDVVAALGKVGVELAACPRLLDFGCGCGRVLCHLPRTEGSSWHGSDIDSEAIGWAQAHLPGLADWSVNGWLPPAPLAGAGWDLILGLSVFTHLDEAAQLSWLEELRRLAAPGGWLLLSVHGPTAHDVLEPGEREQLRRRGFLYKPEARGRLKRDGLPDLYQTAYHEPDYVRRVWGELFELVAYLPRAINQLQDAVVLRRPAR